MVELTWKQERKLSRIYRQINSLCGFLEVLMQLDMGHNRNQRKNILAFICDNAQQLSSALAKDFKNIEINNDLCYVTEDNQERINHSKLLMRKRQRKFKNIKHTCELAGIKVKTRYDMTDILDQVGSY
tara:strand:+ start:194 stop:577 length:384 start_codon:yes stop_codon:yes gene_type:complete